MHRIDTDGHVGNMFSDGNPATGTLGTKVDDDYMNAVQEEICGVIEGTGGTLVKGTNTQLLGSCVAAATANKIVRRDASGRAAFADPAAAGDAATKGWVEALAWTTPTLNSGWSNALSTTKYAKDRQGIVHLQGFPQWATGGASSPFALPVGYRPAQSVVVPTFEFDDVASTFVAKLWFIGSDGTITLVPAGLTNARNYGFDGISFPTA